MTGQALQSASHCRRRSRVVAKSSRVVAKNSRVVASSSRVGGRGRVVARGKILVGRICECSPHRCDDIFANS